VPSGLLAPLELLAVCRAPARGAATVAPRPALSGAGCCFPTAFGGALPRTAGSALRACMGMFIPSRWQVVKHFRNALMVPFFFRREEHSCRASVSGGVVRCLDNLEARITKWQSISTSRTFMEQTSTWMSLWCTPLGKEGEASLLESKNVFAERNHSRPPRAAAAAAR
jgi:hypothetical protein